jgi:hypothetical protein
MDYAIRVLGEATLGLPMNAPGAVFWAWALGLAGLAGWQVVRLARADAPAPATAARAGALLLGVPVMAFAAGVSATSFAQLVLPRTVLAIAPCVALALGAALGRLARRGRGAVATALTATLAVAGLAQCVVLLATTVKSNARELGAAVAAAARDDDLVVIAPAWLASPFNRYCERGGDWIGFPDDEDGLPTRYDDVAARLASPGALAHAKARIDAARRQGRRVWLVMDEADVMDVTRGEALPIADLTRSALARIRANQVRLYLADLYGPARLSLSPLADRWGDEMMTARLFSPETAAHQDGARATRASAVAATTSAAAISRSRTLDRMSRAPGSGPSPSR